MKKNLIGCSKYNCLKIEYSHKFLVPSLYQLVMRSILIKTLNQDVSNFIQSLWNVPHKSDIIMVGINKTL